MSKAVILLRLNKAEARANKLEIEFHKLALDAISRGAYYDELTDAEKDDYCLYMNVARESFEKPDKEYHFKLFKRPSRDYKLSELDLFNRMY